MADPAGTLRVIFGSTLPVVFVAESKVSGSVTKVEPSTGWSVSLTQTAQFKGTKAGDLVNAVMTFNNDKTNTVVST